jgi:hypothetical protein
LLLLAARYVTQEMGFSMQISLVEVQEIHREESSVWHFPISDMEDDDWFCVRINERKTSEELEVVDGNIE